MTSSPTTMRAVRLSAPGPVDNLRLTTLPLPPERDGWVRIRVEAFGLNRSELKLRLGLSAGVSFPRVPGIEAAGTVDPPGAGGSRAQVVAMIGNGAHLRRRLRRVHSCRCPGHPRRPDLPGVLAPCGDGADSLRLRSLGWTCTRSSCDARRTSSVPGRRRDATWARHVMPPPRGGPRFAAGARGRPPV